VLLAISELHLPAGQQGFSQNSEDGRVCERARADLAGERFRAHLRLNVGVESATVCLSQAGANFMGEGSKGFGAAIVAGCLARAGGILKLRQFVCRRRHGKIAQPTGGDAKTTLATVFNRFERPENKFHSVSHPLGGSTAYGCFLRHLVNGQTVRAARERMRQLEYPGRLLQSHGSS
jgi:hypothetical protein